MKRLICRSALPALAAAALLGGCAWSNGPTFGDGATFQEKYGWNEERMLRHGWLPTRNITPPAIYCYRTLATPECYPAPQDGEELRLIGYFAGRTG